MRSRTMRGITSLILVTVISAPLGCGGADATDPTPPPQPPSNEIATVTVEPQTITLHEPGDTATLHAVARNHSGQQLSVSAFTWTSSDTDVASVSDGLVTAGTEGVAWITGQAGGKADSAKVTVLSSPPPPPDIVDATTLHRKVMFGYQGWFTCGNEQIAVNPWRHWFGNSSTSTPSPANLTVDFWPDVTELEADELCATDLTLPDGKPAFVYSNHNRKTTLRHVGWMHEYGIDGVFVQRFLDDLSYPDHDLLYDRVLTYVAEGAQTYGRTFAVMYDITGRDEAAIVNQIKQDWIHLVDELQVTSSGRYLHHKGKPVVAVWGFGFLDRPGTPEQVLDLIEFFHDSPDPRYQATVVGGVPTSWRTLGEDSKKDASWAEAYRAFDIISPWSVGRFSELAGTDWYRVNGIVPDVDAALQAGKEYMPVIWPGFSAHNQNSSLPSNQIPRLGGRFFWRQAYNAILAGSEMLYVAMFDEVDEGTAMYKLSPTQETAPTERPIVTLDADGESLDSDWYLRLGGAASRMLRGDIHLQADIPSNP